MASALKALWFSGDLVRWNGVRYSWCTGLHVLKKIKQDVGAIMILMRTSSGLRSRCLNGVLILTLPTNGGNWYSAASIRYAEDAKDANRWLTSLAVDAASDHIVPIRVGDVNDVSTDDPVLSVGSLQRLHDLRSAALS